MASKTRILEGAEGLFMRYGIKSVTMDDIARELGISKKTLYQHVANKADLIGQIFGCRKAEEKEEIETIYRNSTDAIDEMFGIAKMVIRQLRKITPAAMYDLKKYYGHEWRSFEEEHRSYLYEQLRRNLDEGIAQGLYRKDINPDIIAKLYIGKTSLVVDEELFSPTEYNLEALFRAYFLYHIHGIASAKGLEVLDKHMDRNLDNIE